MKKKSIVFVVYHLVCGGVESALYDLVRLIDKQLFDVTVFCIYGGGEWEQKFIDAGINVMSSSSRLKKYKNPILRILNSIRARRVNYALANRGKGLINAATGKRFDVIAAYHIGSEFHDICFAPRTKAVKYIHGSVATNDAFRLDLQKNSKSLVCFDKIICVSKNAQTDLLKIYPLTNTCVCYNPLDTDALHKKTECLSELPNKPYICAVGRLVPIKGFTRLVKCFKRIVQAGHDIALVIVGDGPDKEVIDETIQQMGLQDRVVMTGYSDNPYTYMKNSLFTVCSSYSEGMPVVMMESLCLGVPVVSSYMPVEELFQGLPCGIVTGVEDEALVNGMQEMLTPKRLTEAKSAATLCSQNISGEKMVETVQRVIADL